MRLRSLIGAVVLVAAAVVVHGTTPTDAEQIAPFVESADVGDWAQGRTFAVRVQDVTLAARVTDGDWVGTTEGVWVVVAVTAETALQPGGLSGSLFLGDLRFDSSTRAGSSSLDGVPLSPGLPEAGELVFEVSQDALSAHGGTARLWLSTSSDPRLDSVVEVPLDLADLEPEELHELVAVERAGR